MTKAINWGIIGPGKIAHKFAQDLAQIESARLSAVLSRSEERAKEFAQAYEAPHAYADPSAFLTCPELDIVYVATPHSHHYEHTMRCLRAGVPVLCEKAFALNSAQAREMTGLAREKGVFLMEALWTRFLPSTLKVLELIEQGAIGRPLSVKADFGFKAQPDPEGRLFSPSLAGGALLDIGIYPVFLAYLILGQPDKLQAMAQFSPTGVDQELGVLFHYDNGSMAHLHATLQALTKTEAFIYGEEGTIHWHTRWHEPTSFSLISPEGRLSNFHFDWEGNGYIYEAKEAMRCLREGLQESPLWPLQQTEGLMALLDQVRSAIGLKYPGEA